MIIIVTAILALLLFGGYFWLKRLNQSLKDEHQRKEKLVEQRSNEQPNADNFPVAEIPQPVSSIDWPTTISTLHQQISKLSLDFLHSRNLHDECISSEGELTHSRIKVDYDARLPSGISDSELNQRIADVGEAYVIRQRATLKLRQEVIPTKTACLRAKESWEALATTLKQINLATAESKETPPFTALVAIKAGSSLISETDEHLKRACKKALARTMPTALAKGPSKKTLEPQIKLLIPALKEALAIPSRMTQQWLETEALVLQARSFQNVCIAQPVKPTSEEVERYLRELSQWAARQLAAQRIASASITKYNAAIEVFSAKLDELRSHVNKVSPLVNKHLDEAILSDIAAAYKLNKELDKEYTIHLFNSSQVAKYAFTSTDAVTSTPVSEADLVNQLQQLTRTVGFAAAQRTVASVKYKTSLYKAEPCDPSIPALQLNFTLDAHLQAFENYLKGVEAADKDRELLYAERGLYSSALNARRDKAESAKSALSKFTTETKKQLNDATSDELRIALAAAEKLCDDQHYANKWDRLV